MKPLTQAETDQLLILLRKIWKYGEPTGTIERIAKNLFKQIIEDKLYQQEPPASE